VSSREPTRAAVIVDALRAQAAEAPLGIRVRGNCMGDLLRNGGLVAVERRSYYWPGDIVVAHWPESGFRVHRVIGGYRKQGQWRLLTQADRSPRPDRSIPVTAVIGKVSGGECAAAAIRVPWQHRIKAWGRFCAFSWTLIGVRLPALGGWDSPAGRARLTALDEPEG
jgi:hypothetical protein